MGYFTVADEVLDEWARELSPIPTLVLIFLIRASDKEGRSFYSFAGIGKRLGVSRKTIKRAILTLQSLGFITITARHKKSSIYRLAWVGSRLPHVGSQLPQRWGNSDPLRTTQEGLPNKEENSLGFSSEYNPLGG